jgi:hypothetical protein
MSTTGAWLRRAALGMLLAVLLVAGLTAKVVVEGEAALAKSDAAFDRGDLRESILYARRAAVLYAPGAPHVGAAYARLGAIAVGAEATSQAEVARQAWGAVRGAALETRHLWTPRAADLERANASLARLSVGEGGAPARERMARILARDDAPRAGWVLVLACGFVLFAVGLALAARGGVAPDGRLSPRKLAVSVAIALVGVACWTLAVYRA